MALSLGFGRGDLHTGYIYIYIYIYIYDYANRY
jgi:hypothetical protein